MHKRRLRATELSEIFEDIRESEELPVEFPGAVVEEAATAGSDGPGGGETRRDLTEIPFVTVDPPEAMDLDQAMALERLDGGGIRVRYAIADVVAFVDPGGLIDEESRRRGTTVYCPDVRVPLHPPILSEGVASLLPDVDRPAVVWELDVDDNGELVRAEVYRALVRSRARYDYQSLQSVVDGGQAPEPLALLPEFGQRRIALGVQRGAITLRLPEQETELVKGEWQIVIRPELAVERWNAEVSLLTGMAAADIMLESGIGILRTLPAPGPEVEGEIRAAVRAVGIDWTADQPISEVLAGLDPSHPRDLAVFERSTQLLRGAGYLGFVDGVPAGDIGHAGLATTYAHATAPLRRLVDRFVLEICLASTSERAVPEWVLEGIETVPAVMNDTGRRAGSVESRCVNAVEAAVMGVRIGQTVEAVVLSNNRSGGEVWIASPPILTWIPDLSAKPGSVVSLRVEATDIDRGTISFVRQV